MNKAKEEEEETQNESEQEQTETEIEKTVEKKGETNKSHDDIKLKVEILDAVFHPKETDLIALGLINGKLKLYKITNEKKKRLLSVHKLHKKSIRKLSYAYDSSHLIFTASKDKSIKLTDVNYETNVLNIENAHKKAINSFVTVDNWLIASGDDDGCVKLWDYRRKNACMESNECQDYISEMIVSKDKKVLLATSGEGTLTAFHTRKKKMLLQSELIDSELLSLTYIKNDQKVICGSGEGVLYIFNHDEWGNMSDRFPGHPSSIDSVVKLSEDVVLTGCFDGNIRACHVLPNRFVGVVGTHDPFPIQRLCLNADSTICASISHDERVKFWNVENLANIKLDPSSKSNSKTLKSKKITSTGKSENFFAGLIDGKDDEEGDDDGDSDDSDDSDGSDDGGSSNSDDSDDSDDDKD